MSDASAHEDHNQASDAEKVDGIVEQTRGDLQQGNITDIPDALAQRLKDAGFEVSDAEFQKLLERLRA